MKIEEVFAWAESRGFAKVSRTEWRMPRDGGYVALRSASSGRHLNVVASRDGKESRIASAYVPRLAIEDGMLTGIGLESAFSRLGAETRPVPPRPADGEKADR